MRRIAPWTRSSNFRKAVVEVVPNRQNPSDFLCCFAVAWRQGRDWSSLAPRIIALKKARARTRTKALLRHDFGNNFFWSEKSVRVESVLESRVVSCFKRSDYLMGLQIFLCEWWTYMQQENLLSSFLRTCLGGDLKLNAQKRWLVHLFLSLVAAKNNKRWWPLALTLAAAVEVFHGGVVCLDQKYHPQFLNSRLFWEDVRDA